MFYVHISSAVRSMLNTEINSHSYGIHLTYSICRECWSGPCVCFNMMLLLQVWNLYRFQTCGPGTTSVAFTLGLAWFHAKTFQEYKIYMWELWLCSLVGNERKKSKQEDVYCAWHGTTFLVILINFKKNSQHPFAVVWVIKGVVYLRLATHTSVVLHKQCSDAVFFWH